MVFVSLDAVLTISFVGYRSGAQVSWTYDLLQGVKGYEEYSNCTFINDNHYHLQQHCHRSTSEDFSSEWQVEDIYPVGSVKHGWLRST